MSERQLDKGDARLTERQNMIVFVCVPAWGVRWARLALGLWWIDVVMSVWASCGMLYVL